MEKNKELYAVMVTGMNAPSKLYDNYQLAESEAERLAIKERRKTYVLMAITELDVNDVKITKL